MCEPRIDLFIPTGCAIENARGENIGILTRDGYHLTLNTGRYIAALTLLSALLGKEIADIEYTPEGTTDVEKEAVLRAVAAAIADPLVRKRKN